MKIRSTFIATLFLSIAISAVSSTATAATLETLKAQIENAIPHARGQVGVAIKHLESGTEVLVNADGRYPMASTFKLPLLVELYYEKAAGKLSLDDRIEVMPSDLHVGSGAIIALFDPPGVQLSIHNLINMMMRVSDNSAADILLNRAGAANVTTRMKALGLDSIRVDRSAQELILDQSGLDYAKYGALPVREVRKMLDAIDAQTASRANDQFNRTDKDVAKASELNRILEKLYRGEIVDRASSDEIIDILKECQTGTARIPGLLPMETVVAHKSGSIGGSVNDTGIVFLPYNAGHLAVTVLMKDAKASTADRERVIADITRYAYDYFVSAYGNVH
jgi:beta-lactamase class A